MRLAEMLLLNFFVVRAEVFHGIPEKNRDFAIQLFVQTIFHFSTSLHRPRVLNTIGELCPRCI